MLAVPAGTDRTVFSRTSSDQTPGLLAYQERPLRCRNAKSALAPAATSSTGLPSPAGSAIEEQRAKSANRLMCGARPAQCLWHAA